MLTAIVNHLWQSTLAVAVIAALAAMLRKPRRSCALLALVVGLGQVLGAVRGARAARQQSSAAHARRSSTCRHCQRRSGVLAEPMRRAAPWTPLAIALVVIWAVGMLAIASSWMARARKARALVRASVPCTTVLPAIARAVDAAATLDARTSPALVEPSLVGIARPVLLLPRGIAERLTAAQLDAVIAHELAHWRRRDNLTAALHMLVEAVVWFHPLVWWIGARLVEERERACDEAVVRAGHDGRTVCRGNTQRLRALRRVDAQVRGGRQRRDLKRRVVEIGRNRVMSDLRSSRKCCLERSHAPR
jgi:beta-lactamase regulating signal transducer with metallopeptidase domain